MPDLSAHLLTALAAASDITQDGEQWIEVMATGENLRNGRWLFTVTEVDLGTYAASIRAKGDQTPLDYDHSYAEGNGTLASGWFTGDAEVRDTDAGKRLYARVRWTPRAVEAIQAGEYRFISPEFSFAEKDAKTGLMTRAREFLAATLTNRPFFKELAPVGAEDDHPKADEAANEKETTMSLTIIAKSLGLADDATEDAITAALAAKDTEIAELTAKNTELAATATVSADLVAQAAAGAQAAKELQTMKVDSLITAAVKDEKILPAVADVYRTMAAADFDGVKSLLDATPAKATALATEKGSDTARSRTGITPGAAAAFDTATVKASDESVELHSAAEAILATQGKLPGQYTADEYVAALEKATRDAVVA